MNRFTAARDAIHRAAIRPDSWPEALTAITDYLGATGGMLGHVALGGGPSAIITSRLREDLAEISAQ